MNKILITGASSAIGKNLITKLNKKGQIIIAHYSSSKNFLSFVKNKKFKSKIIPIKCNFKKKNDLKKFLTKLSKYKVNSIVHLACENLNIKRFTDLNYNDYDRQFIISLRPIFEILKNHIGYMSNNKDSRVIFVLSSSVKGMPPAFMNNYVSLKYLLLGFMKSLVSEYKTKNITFNSISPSMIDTPFIKNIDKKIIELSKFNNPKKRLTKASEVTDVIKFLLSSNSRFINGSNTIVSGGEVF
jgi:3-oxoacyl-[acyl-carrier protein] reductase